MILDKLSKFELAGYTKEESEQLIEICKKQDISQEKVLAALSATNKVGELVRTINIPHTRKVLFDEDKKKVDRACMNYPMGSWQIGEIAELSGQLYGLGIDVVDILKKKLNPMESIQVTISMEDEEENTNWETEKAFDLDKIRLEILSKEIEKALKHFEDNPKICWTQIPMEKPLWEKLKIYVEKEIPKEVTRESLEESHKCPSCQSDRWWKDGDHCKDCGQKLKWRY